MSNESEIWTAKWTFSLMLKQGSTVSWISPEIVCKRLPEQELQSNRLLVNRALRTMSLTTKKQLVIDPMLKLPKVTEINFIKKIASL